MACSRQRSATANPPSAWRKIPMIWVSLNRLFLIKISSCLGAEKILPSNPVSWRGDYHIMPLFQYPRALVQYSPDRAAAGQAFEQATVNPKIGDIATNQRFKMSARSRNI